MCVCPPTFELLYGFQILTISGRGREITGVWMARTEDKCSGKRHLVLSNLVRNQQAHTYTNTYLADVDTSKNPRQKSIHCAVDSLTVEQAQASSQNIPKRPTNRSTYGSCRNRRFSRSIVANHAESTWRRNPHRSRRAAVEGQTVQGAKTPGKTPSHPLKKLVHACTCGCNKSLQIWGGR